MISDILDLSARRGYTKAAYIKKKDKINATWAKKKVEVVLSSPSHNHHQWHRRFPLLASEHRRPSLLQTSPFLLRRGRTLVPSLHQWPSITWISFGMARWWRSPRLIVRPSLVTPAPFSATQSCKWRDRRWLELEKMATRDDSGWNWRRWGPALVTYFCTRKPTPDDTVETCSNEFLLLSRHHWQVDPRCQRSYQFLFRR
jgi:hypothetical protein